MSNNKNKPIFLLVTAANCDFCIKFKQNVWDIKNGLKSKLEKKGDVQIVQIDLPTTGSSPSKTEYHKDLYKFIQWFPTIMLFPSSLWYNHNSKLEGEVMGGKIVKDIVEFDKDAKLSYTELPILDWMNKTLTTSNIFKNNLLSTTKDKPTIILTNGNNVIGTTNNTINNDNNRNEQYVNGKRIVPTYGSYIKFRSSHIK